MTNPLPFSSLEALQAFVIQSSLEDFKAQLSYLSPAEIGQTLFFLQKESSSTSSNKLESLFHFIDSPTSLEKLGKALSVPQFLAVLDFLHQHSPYQNRLPYILVGLQPSVFSQALYMCQPEPLTLLKHESLFEPLQYQLTQFVHESEALQKHTEQAIQQLQQDFQFIQPEKLTQESLQVILNQIAILENQLIDYLERLKQALSIVWNTDRIDLIDKLSSINEILQHQLIHSIGVRGGGQDPSTGLYLTLEQHLSSIFDTSLQDSDAAMEGLTRLSIWYLRDYWELGLLPSVKQMSDLEAHHPHSLAQIQKHLEKLQIQTVGDLKKAYLFSRPLLKAYITQHQELLTKD